VSAINDVITGSKVRDELTAQLLSELQHLNATQTEMMARLAGGLILNNVLGVETVLIPASGFVQRDYPLAVGAVEIRTPARPVIFAAGGGASSPPQVGTGVYPVPANTVQVINLGSTTFTVYGTPGDTLSWQVFTKGGFTGATSVQSTAVARPGTALDVVGTAAAAAAVTATLPAVAGKTTYLTGFELTWDTTGSTAAASDAITTTGLPNILTWKFGSQVAVGGFLVVPLPEPVAASAVNTAIVLSSGAVANRAGLALVVHGYQL
jgi:hypothetical protein